MKEWYIVINICQFESNAVESLSLSHWPHSFRNFYENLIVTQLVKNLTLLLWNPSFPATILYIFPSYFVLAKYPTHLIVFDLFTLIIINTSYETPNCVIFSITVLLSPL